MTHLPVEVVWRSLLPMYRKMSDTCGGKLRILEVLPTHPLRQCTYLYKNIENYLCYR
ncbi:hypothetical protein VB740_22440 [Nostoc sp. UHCC 0251]|nr:hypothetical protein [Nostoc sp. UHCC 0251]